MANNKKWIIATPNKNQHFNFGYNKMLIIPHSDWQCKVLVISFSLSLHSILKTNLFGN